MKRRDFVKSIAAVTTSVVGTTCVTAANAAAEPAGKDGNKKTEASPTPEN